MIVRYLRRDFQEQCRFLISSLVQIFYTAIRLARVISISGLESVFGGPGLEDPPHQPDSSFPRAIPAEIRLCKHLVPEEE